MSNKQDEPSSAVSKNIWTRLVRLIINVKTLKTSDDNPVEEQTENSRKGGTIWEAVRKADQTALEHLLRKDPNEINARGPVGECPIHMLFLYGTETHLNMARYLIKNFPSTITQIYNKDVN
jgi:hypothetical protein